MDNYKQEKMEEHLRDITQSDTRSNCCWEPVMYEDLCSKCKEHCDPIYEELECTKCGGDISAITEECTECGNTEFQKHRDLK